jgi:hypothetical protein
MKIILGTSIGEIYNFDTNTKQISFLYSTNTNNESINGLSLYNNELYVVSNYTIHKFDKNLKIVNKLFLDYNTISLRDVTISKDIILVCSSKGNKIISIDKKYNNIVLVKDFGYFIKGDNDSLIYINDISKYKDNIYLNVGSLSNRTNSECGIIKLDFDLNEIERINVGYNSSRVEIYNDDIYSLCNTDTINNLKPALLLNNTIIINFSNDYTLYDFCINDSYICICGYLRNFKYDCIHSGFLSLFDNKYNLLFTSLIKNIGAITSCIFYE